MGRVELGSAGIGQVSFISVSWVWLNLVRPEQIGSALDGLSRIRSSLVRLDNIRSALVRLGWVKLNLVRLG